MLINRFLAIMFFFCNILKFLFYVTLEIYFYIYIYIAAQVIWQTESVLFLRLHRHQSCCWSCTRSNSDFSPSALLEKPKLSVFLPQISINSFCNLYHFITIHLKVLKKLKLIRRIWGSEFPKGRTPLRAPEAPLDHPFPVVLFLPLHLLGLMLNTRSWG